MKNQVTVRILEQNFTMNTDASPEKVAKIADFLNRNLEQIMSRSKAPSPLQASILAALNITEKYFDLLEKQAAFKSRVSEKSKKILGLLENQATE